MKTLLGAIFGLVIAVAGLLAYKTYSAATPYDEIWVGINSRMPAPVRAWTCQTMEQRLRASPGGKESFKTPPKGCESVWN